MPEKFFVTLLETAPAVAVCLFALRMVSKRLFDSQDAHIAAYKDRVTALEKHASDCNDDREELHKKHAELQRQVIDKLTAMARGK